jgi:hypothetical protein
MENHILSVTRNIIPYVKELRSLEQIKSSSDAILMQQLDYWFARYPDGFYKFLSPCQHPDYNNGDSWIEELGFSSKEFRTAFSHIGIVYKSKKLYDIATDKFQNHFYCSYQDRISKKTYYFRNHTLVDQALFGLNPEKKALKPFSLLEVTNGHLQKLPMGISRSDRSAFLEVTNGHLQKLPIGTSKSIYTDITPEITSEPTQPEAVDGGMDSPTGLSIPGVQTIPLSTNSQKVGSPQISDYLPNGLNVSPVENLSQQAKLTTWGEFESLVREGVEHFKLQSSHKRIYKNLLERLFLLTPSKLKSFLNWRLNALKTSSAYKDRQCNLITVLGSLNNNFRDDPEKVETFLVEWESFCGDAIAENAKKIPVSTSLRDKWKQEKVNTK